VKNVSVTSHQLLRTPPSGTSSEESGAILTDDLPIYLGLGAMGIKPKASFTEMRLAVHF
jgi:hypothetical protein